MRTGVRSATLGRGGVLVPAGRPVDARPADGRRVRSTPRGPGVARMRGRVAGSGSAGPPIRDGIRPDRTDPPIVRGRRAVARAGRAVPAADHNAERVAPVDSAAPAAPAALVAADRGPGRQGDGPVVHRPAVHAGSSVAKTSHPTDPATVPGATARPEADRVPRGSSATAVRAATEAGTSRDRARRSAAVRPGRVAAVDTRPGRALLARGPEEDSTGRPEKDSIARARTASGRADPDLAGRRRTVRGPTGPTPIRASGPQSHRPISWQTTRS